MMKKSSVLLTALTLVCLALFSLTASAAGLPKVAVLYINNAKTTYDNEVDQKVLGDLALAL